MAKHLGKEKKKASVMFLPIFAQVTFVLNSSKVQEILYTTQNLTFSYYYYFKSRAKPSKTNRMFPIYKE